MEKWGYNHDNQFGFTKGGKIEYSLYLLQYITNHAYDKHTKYYKNLYFSFIDFSKAYDSVSREMLIYTLKKYHIHERIIDKIVALYTNDETTIRLGNCEEKIRVTSGIRQGCALSTLLFKMITYCIIEELEEKGVMFRTEGMELNSVWVADDVTLISNSIINTEENVKILKEVAARYGLHINLKKSKVVQVKGKKTEIKIAGMEVVEELQYMGVTIGGKGKRIFQLDKSRWLKRILKETAMLYKKVSSSYDKVTIGKALWKQVIVSKVMFARGVLIQSKEDLGKAQKIEYGVYRHLIGVAGYTAIEAIRGEIGASLMETRQMEASILFIKDGLECNFEKIRIALENNIKNNKGDWIHRINKFIKTVNLTWTEIRNKNRQEIRYIIRKYDTSLWEEGMKNKSSLYMYKEEKRRWGTKSATIIPTNLNC